MPKKSQEIPEEYKEYERKLAEELGLRIRKLRLALKLRQEDLRQRMELEGVYISRSQFSRIEKGEFQPKASEIIALSAALKVSFDCLLLGKEDGDT